MDGILLVRADKSLFKEESAARDELRLYAAELGSVQVLVTSVAGKSRIVEGGLVLHSLRGGLLGRESVMHAINRLVLSEGIKVVSVEEPFEDAHAALAGIAGTGASLHVSVATDFLSPWYERTGVFRSVKVRVPKHNKSRVQLAGEVLPKAKAVRAVSERIAASLAARYGIKASVVPPPVDPRVPPPSKLPEEGAGFCFATRGPLTPERRIEDILMALGRIKLQYPSARLCIIGEGSERATLVALARKLGLSSSVAFLGERADARALVGSAHAYIDASAHAGYQVPLVEAALARLPIIATDAGIVGEVFRGYEEVLASPPGDPAALAVHMVGLLNDHQARIQLAMNAEHAARNHLAAHPDPVKAIARDIARARG